MGILDLFRKKNQQPAEVETKDDSVDLELCSGMRVEVMDRNGHLLFVAKMLGLRETTADLHQYSEMALPLNTEEPVPVYIRGYNDRKKKAVYMEGKITPKPNQVWQVDELTITKTGNDRAFFRLSTNLEASATTLTGHNAGEKSCRLLNISVGGACVGSEYDYHEGDKFLLKVQLLEERDPSLMLCQVLRVTKRENSKSEYGCKFLELTDADQEKITQIIFELQRQKTTLSDRPSF